MLFLALDVGNTHTVIGLFQESALRKTWRVSTYPLCTVDEFKMKLDMILLSSSIRMNEVEAIVVSSVVPPFTRMLQLAFSSQQSHVKLLVIDHSWPFSFDIKTDFPSQVGTDRLVNVEAVIRKYGAPSIIIDNGTATTFSAVGVEYPGRPAFLGGSILAGVELTMQAIAQKTALLHTVELTAPPKAIGTNTTDALRSGIILGHACLIDGMIRKFKLELGTQNLPVIATGGMSYLIKGLSTELTHCDPDLTLKGIAYLYESIRKR